jgi:hypothetical protein
MPWGASVRPQKTGSIPVSGVTKLNLNYAGRYHVCYYVGALQ